MNNTISFSTTIYMIYVHLSIYNRPFPPLNERRNQHRIKLHTRSVVYVSPLVYNICNFLPFSHSLGVFFIYYLNSIGNRSVRFYLLIYTISLLCFCTGKGDRDQASFSFPFIHSIQAFFIETDAFLLMTCP